MQIRKPIMLAIVAIDWMVMSILRRSWTIYQLGVSFPPGTDIPLMSASLLNRTSGEIPISIFSTQAAFRAALVTRALRAPTPGPPCEGGGLGLGSRSVGRAFGNSGPGPGSQEGRIAADKMR